MESLTGDTVMLRALFDLVSDPDPHPNIKPIVKPNVIVTVT